MTSRFVVLFYFLLAAGICFGQGPPADDEKAASEQRLKLMQQRVGSLKAIDAGGEAVAFVKDPLLRYSDEGRGIVDASLWSLGKSGRPRAILVLELYDDDTLQYEFTGADNLPKSVAGAGWSWQPSDVDSKWKEIPDQPPPDDSRRARRRQIPAIAGKLTASETWRGETISLKQLPQPIYWYHDEESGILDGAVYALPMERTPRFSSSSKPAPPMPVPTGSPASPAWAPPGSTSHSAKSRSGPGPQAAAARHNRTFSIRKACEASSHDSSHENAHPAFVFLVAGVSHRSVGRRARRRLAHAGARCHAQMRSARRRTRRPTGTWAGSTARRAAG